MQYLVDDAAVLDDTLGAHEDQVDFPHDVAHGRIQNDFGGDSDLAEGVGGPVAAPFSFVGVK